MKQQSCEFNVSPQFCEATHTISEVRRGKQSLLPQRKDGPRALPQAALSIQEVMPTRDHKHNFL